ncbi:MBL fold metallo-hydrolase [Candidatus Omnitrophota bacterium]
MILKNSGQIGLKKFVVGPLCTNCYLIYEKSSRRGMLIDPGAYDDEIVAYIKDNGIDMVCILNTHGHADHIAGDAAFGLPVMIHELDEPCLRNSARNLFSFLEGEVPAVTVKKLLKGGDVVDLGALKLEIIHTPGHTPGSISVKCGDMLFSGDVLFFEGVGRTDLPEGSHATLMNTINERLMTLPDSVKVFPGHGPETTIGHERHNNPFLS